MGIGNKEKGNEKEMNNGKLGVFMTLPPSYIPLSLMD